ncbi:hypothetical protein EAI_07034 [Harpegnathos saltator]|uniref:Uncharacterized protein n=1 Tax=Harpegnathos saltator TaxID=610380 RepID=E2BVD9_HARSA|nr:hypothetical protein EAI_07034 [Harpegnathos saltator]
MGPPSGTVPIRSRLHSSLPALLAGSRSPFIDFFFSRAPLFRLLSARLCAMGTVALNRQKDKDSEEMQRCPYIHEMKERLLNQPTPTDSLDMERLDGGTPVKEANLHNDYPAQTNPGVIPEPPEMPPDSLIGTVVKLNSDGYGSHTSPAHARQPLVPQNANNPPLCLTPTYSGPVTGTLPKNAK